MWHIILIRSCSYRKLCKFVLRFPDKTSVCTHTLGTKMFPVLFNFTKLNLMFKSIKTGFVIDSEVFDPEKLTTLVYALMMLTNRS